MSRTSLDAVGLTEVIEAFGTGLLAHRGTINRLNVYPVPDGDTGTNMHLTVESVLSELRELGGDRADLRSVTRAISHGSLMGARGNSGVILCQILRGLAEACAASQVGLDAPCLAGGLTAADAAARAGVMRPVEGTILTVVAAGAKGAVAAVNDGMDLSATAHAARREAVEALARTPDLLQVLAKAGVVDAGGAGLICLFDAICHVVDKTALPAMLPLPSHVWANLGSGRAEGAPDDVATVGGCSDGAESSSEENLAGLRYEVMYLLEADDALIPDFKAVWAGIGDSIVVVGGDGLWNCHIHTDDIGAAIEAAVDAGRPRRIRVTDLLEQVEEESWVLRAEQSDAISAPLQPGESGTLPVTSVIAVATGDGIRRIFYSLGARHIVTGGQSMNPSTADILQMIDAVDGEQAVILPNNSNIYAVAAQAAEVAERPTVVVRTAGVQEGFAALLEYDPEASAVDNAAAMTEAASRVVAGEVTQAVRASETPAGKVGPGDWIGLTRSGIEVIGDSAHSAACALLERIVSPSHEIVTIIEGAGSKPADTRRITEWLAEHRPDACVELHHGGQPLYPYLLASE